MLHLSKTQSIKAPMPTEKKPTGEILYKTLEEYQRKKEKAVTREFTPFLDVSKGRNYRKFYRIACDFHEQHHPPKANVEYWEQITEDINRIAAVNNNDPFLLALLSAIFDELERELKQLKKSII